MTARGKILICDDAPGFRLLLETVFSDAGFEVVGTAVDWEEAEQLAASTAPDVVILDLWLPIFDPAAANRVRTSAPQALLAVVSSLAADEARVTVADVDGIDLVLSKRDPPDKLVAAVLARLDEQAA